MISLKDSDHDFGGGIGRRAQHLHSNPYYGSCVCLFINQFANAHTHPRRFGLPSHKGSTTDRAGCHLCDSFWVRLHTFA